VVCVWTDEVLRLVIVICGIEDVKVALPSLPVAVGRAVILSVWLPPLPLPLMVVLEFDGRGTVASVRLASSPGNVCFGRTNWKTEHWMSRSVPERHQPKI
jgi:hypothetical protein